MLFNCFWKMVPPALAFIQDVSGGARFAFGLKFLGTSLCIRHPTKQGVVLAGVADVVFGVRGLAEIKAGRLDAVADMVEDAGLPVPGSLTGDHAPDQSASVRYYGQDCAYEGCATHKVAKGVEAFEALLGLNIEKWVHVQCM